MNIHMEMFLRQHSNLAPVATLKDAEVIWKGVKLKYVRVTTFQGVDFVTNAQVKNAKMWQEKGGIPLEPVKYTVVEYKDFEVVGKYGEYGEKAYANRAVEQLKILDKDFDYLVEETVEA